MKVDKKIIDDAAKIIKKIVVLCEKEHVPVNVFTMVTATLLLSNLQQFEVDGIVKADTINDLNALYECISDLVYSPFDTLKEYINFIHSAGLQAKKGTTIFDKSK